MDDCGLLSGGAPADEFDGESKEISERIHAELSAREIADIITEVFNSQFSEEHEMGAFLPVAEAIRKDLLV